MIRATQMRNIGTKGSSVERHAGPVPASVGRRAADAVPVLARAAFPLGCRPRRRYILGIGFDSTLRAKLSHDLRELIEFRGFPGEHGSRPRVSGCPVPYGQTRDNFIFLCALGNSNRFDLFDPVYNGA